MDSGAVKVGRQMIKELTINMNIGCRRDIDCIYLLSLSKVEPEKCERWASRKVLRLAEFIQALPLDEVKKRISQISEQDVSIEHRHQFDRYKKSPMSEFADRNQLLHPPPYSGNRCIENLN